MHIQSRALPPEGYPHSVEHGVPFDEIYPDLSTDEYEDRKQRIYQPKLDWSLSVLEGAGYSIDSLAKKKWVEVGCGAGYFLSCLQDLGFENTLGLERDPLLVQRANSHLPVSVVALHEHNLEESIEAGEVDVLVAFFVFEHVPDLAGLFERIGSLPSGTLVVFSVPVFSLTFLLEHIFEGCASRSLDSVVHTQLFTEDSLNHAMKIADCSTLGSWVFGQDADDLTRFLLAAVSTGLPRKLLMHLQTGLTHAIDGVQSALDHASLADQRHIIAVRN